MFSVTEKVVVITGGASGIGAATARRLATAGATCVIADLTNGEGLADEIGATFVHCDVTDAKQMEALVTTIAKRDGRLDALVNNAGIHGPQDGLLATAIDDGRQVLDVNLIGVVNGIRAAAEFMNPGSSIVNTASMAGIVGFPGPAWYAMSKWAVVGLTKNAAIELGPRGIRVNCVCPTGIDTPMVADSSASALDHWASKTLALANQHTYRLGTADEVAAAIHFLISDDAAMVNGHALYVDGGLAAGLSQALVESVVGHPITKDGKYVE